MREITLKENNGKGEAGDVYVQGLHGVPSLYYATGDRDPKEWWWKKDSDVKQNDFIYYKNLKELEEENNVNKREG